MKRDNFKVRWYDLCFGRIAFLCIPYCACISLKRGICKEVRFFHLHPHSFWRNIFRAKLNHLQAQNPPFSDAKRLPNITEPFLKRKTPSNNKYPENNTTKKPFGQI